MIDIRNRQVGTDLLRPSVIFTLTGLLVVTFMLATTDSVLAQKKYTPEHPFVKEMADRAVKTLQSGHSKEGHNTMAALAIVEHSKRYNNSVPRDNKVVQSAVEHIRQQCKSQSFINEKETYYPAIALILLAEVDSARNHDQIVYLLDVLKKRQNADGSYTYKNQDNADCSQTQFAGLAMWVAKSHNFDVDIPMAKNTLNWFCRVARGGQWHYKYTNTGEPTSQPTLSMQAAGISSVYLLADMLQLNRRVVDLASKTRKNDGLGLPNTVHIYVPPVDGKGKAQRTDGPLTNFDRGLLGGTQSAGNRSFDSAFNYSYPTWNYYYLYALERYCYFREQAEGDLGGGKFRNWYDGGVKFLADQQQKDGSFKKTHGLTSEATSTAFAVLFLVRSSEIISFPPAEGQTNGAIGFGDGVLRRTNNGKIVDSQAEQDLGAMIALLKENETLSSEQLERINESLKKQIVEFRNQDEKSRAEVQAFLRSMVGARNYYRRLIAVRFLAGEQDMDNVPGLIYAVSDPDFRIAYEAHQGLRLISRKIDSMKLSQTTRDNARRDPGPLKRDSPQIVTTMRSEFDSMERRWSDWYLKIRPNAQLYKQDRDEIGAVSR